ncbi:MAG: non-hydrolyzing UDP-N-acetylglucosamine 2-epimerase [Acidimicrobiia bacterium]
MTNPYGFPPNSVSVVLGTRPEIVKLSQIIHLLGEAALVVHTGQHYDPNLSDVFFRDLGLANPDMFLKVGGVSRGQQIGAAVTSLDELLAETKPLAVLVQGDTNSVAAGAIAANARNVFLCHIEAGLRSRDWGMPEEHNRVITDHLSSLCCAPTETAVANLAAEGIIGDRVVLTGNTVVEAVNALLPADRSDILAKFGVQSGRFVLSTFHRPENVDDPEAYSSILSELAALPLPVLLPLHPRSVARAEAFGLGPLLEKLKVVEPVGYCNFLGLEAEAALMISDSGGIAEEVSVLKRPLVVVRNSTERPEVMGTFAVRVGAGPEISAAAHRLLDAGWEHLADIPTPYGDGSASHRSLEALAARLVSPPPGEKLGIEYEGADPRRGVGGGDELDAAGTVQGGEQ